MEESLLERLRDARETEAARRAYADFWARDDARDSALQALVECAGDPGALADEGRRMQLRLLLLGLAVRREAAAYRSYLALIRSPGFLAALPKDDWLVVEIPRVLGLLGGPGCLADIAAVVRDREVPLEIREQVMMALTFRWLDRQEADGDVYEAVKDMLEKGLDGLERDSQLGMALVVNAIAVGGERLKGRIQAFLEAGDENLRRSVSEKNLRSFLGLGSRRVKDMVKQNFEGEFKDPDREIGRIIDPPQDAPAVPKATQPIVREEPKVRRNDPCPCGSGLKYKKCCGK